MDLGHYIPLLYQLFYAEKMMVSEGKLVYYSLFPLTEKIELAIPRLFPFLGQMVKITLMSFSAIFSPFWYKSKDFPIVLTDSYAVNLTIFSRKI